MFPDRPESTCAGSGRMCRIASWSHERSGEVLLALVVEGYLLDYLQEPNAVGTLGYLLVFVACLDLMPHNV